MIDIVASHATATQQIQQLFSCQHADFIDKLIHQK